MLQDEVLIAGFGRRGHAVGDIPGVRFKVSETHSSVAARGQGRGDQGLGFGVLGSYQQQQHCDQRLSMAWGRGRMGGGQHNGEAAGSGRRKDYSSSVAVALMFVPWCALVVCGWASGCAG